MPHCSRPIQLMLSVSSHRAQTIALLVLYNVAFIAPLAAVFVGAFLGVRSEKLQEFFHGHIAPAKIAVALFFAALGSMLFQLA